MLISLDLSSSIPIYVQIRNQIVIGISKGDFEIGEKLPPIRVLAKEAGVNTMTVNKAYQLLKQEGYIYTDRRKGAIICSKGNGTGKLSLELKKKLKLIICEASFNGVSKKEFIEHCNEIYNEMGND